MGAGLQGAFHLKPGQWTDDASMGRCLSRFNHSQSIGLALADSLLSHPAFDPIDLMLRFVAWWYCGYSNAFQQDPDRSDSVGLGGMIHASLDTFLLQGRPYTTSGDSQSSGCGLVDLHLL